MTNRFEERLLVELRSLVAERPAPRPTASRRRLVPIGATAGVLTIAGAIAVPLLTGGGSAAYAVTRNDDGSVSVEVASLEDAAGLQQKLRDAGVPAVVQYIPPGKGCKEQTFTPARAASPAGGRLGLRGEKTAGGGVDLTFTIDRSAIVPGRTLVIQTATGVPRGDGSPPGNSIMVAWAAGDVAPCELVDAAQAAPQPLPGPAVTSSDDGGPSAGTRTGP